MDSTGIFSWIKAKKWQIAACVFILLYGGYMLVTGAKQYGLTDKPLSPEVFYSTEINGHLNYAAHTSDDICFSLLERPEEFYKLKLTPVSDGSFFLQHAAPGDFIIKHENSDTLTLIKNNVSYSYRITRENKP